MYLCVFFFFFKQKTAYEMRISDWSSDMCSSDLRPARPQGRAKGQIGRLFDRRQRDGTARRRQGPAAGRGDREKGARLAPAQQAQTHLRSEEHTSELPSLMRT